MLQSLGSSPSRDNDHQCCDCCSPSALTLPTYSKLNIFVQRAAVAKKKRRRAVREVDTDRLKEKLLEARGQALTASDSYCMCGVDFFCSTDAIIKLCDQAKYVEDISDFPVELFGIRKDIKAVFFSVICESCPLIKDVRIQRRRLT